MTAIQFINDTTVKFHEWVQRHSAGQLESFFKTRPDPRKLDWEDSPIQERILRLGQEHRAFNLDLMDRSTLIRVARASLMQSCIKYTIV